MWCLTNCLAAQHQPLVLSTVVQLQSEICWDVHCRRHLVVPGCVVQELAVGGVVPNLELSDFLWVGTCSEVHIPRAITRPPSIWPTSTNGEVGRPENMHRCEKSELHRTH